METNNLPIVEYCRNCGHEFDIWEICENPDRNPSINDIWWVSQRQYGKEIILRFFEYKKLTWETFLTEYIQITLLVTHLSKIQREELKDIMECLYLKKII